jgi:hypothetical protein
MVIRIYKAAPKTKILIEIISGCKKYARTGPNDTVIANAEP